VEQPGCLTSASSRATQGASRLIRDGYLFVKTPVFHIIYEAATLWATMVGWMPDDEFV
jgi:hypothetical protein